MLKRRKPSRIDQIAVHPGTYRTRIVSVDRGLVFDQPSMGALDMDHPIGGSAAVGPFGNRAEALLTPLNPHLRSILPVAADRLNNPGPNGNLTRKMLHNLLWDARQQGTIGSTLEVTLVLPDDTHNSTNEVLVHACQTAGAQQTHATSVGVATFNAIPGPQNEPRIFIDFGACHSTLTAMQNNEIIYRRQLSSCGDDFDQAIIKGLLTQFNLQITRTEAQTIKHHIGAATPRSLLGCTNNSQLVSGLSIAKNQQSQIEVNSSAIHQFIAPLLDRLAYSIRSAFAELNRELKESAYDSAIQLCGGGAELSRIDQLVMGATDLPVQVVKQPGTCAVRGAVASLANASIHRSPNTAAA